MVAPTVERLDGFEHGVMLLGGGLQFQDDNLFYKVYYAVRSLF